MKYFLGVLYFVAFWFWMMVLSVYLFPEATNLGMRLLGAASIILSYGFAVKLARD
jgi:hypothetical protein